MVIGNRGHPGRIQPARREQRVRFVGVEAGFRGTENLAPALRSETAILLGELYRHSSGWKFKVIGQGYDNGIAGIAGDYGVPL